MFEIFCLLYGLKDESGGKIRRTHQFEELLKDDLILNKAGFKKTGVKIKFPDDNLKKILGWKLLHITLKNSSELFSTALYQYGFLFFLRTYR